MAKQSRKYIIEKRRETVASLSLRGLSVRQIREAMIEARQGDESKMENGVPKPWSIGTIQSDLKAMEKIWIENSQKSVEQRRARHNAELEELKNKGWTEGDRQLVLASIREQIKLYGLDTKNIQLGGIPGGEPIPTQQNKSLLDGIDLDSLSDEQLSELEQLLTVIDGFRSSEDDQS